MRGDTFTEATVKSVTFAWLEGLDWQIVLRPEIVSGEFFSEREDCRHEMLERKLRDTVLPSSSPASCG